MCEGVCEGMYEGVCLRGAQEGVFLRSLRVRFHGYCVGFGTAFMDWDGSGIWTFASYDHDDTRLRAIVVSYITILTTLTQ